VVDTRYGSSNGIKGCINLLLKKTISFGQSGVKCISIKAWEVLLHEALFLSPTGEVGFVLH